MPKNLEIKARVRSLKAAESQAKSLGARRAGVLRQVDTYFAVPEGRLKLREIRGRATQLIRYDRPSSAGTRGRWSEYEIIPSRVTRTFIRHLAERFPVVSRVEKVRTLYLFENSRIHLDRVRGLGTFLEFEVIADRGQRQAKGMLEHLRDHFQLKERDTVAGSYADL